MYALYRRTLRVEVKRILHRQIIPVVSFANNSSSSAPAAKTALYDLHKRHDGKIINFGGYLLPVVYADLSITASHLHTREWGSVFDVSHMLQTYIRGRHAIATIESVCTADVRTAPLGASMLTCFLNSNGGILDDLIITKVADNQLYVVSNAAMKEQDTQIMSAAVERFRKDGNDVSIEFLDPAQQSLLAVQGPQAINTLTRLISEADAERIKRLPFMHTMLADIAGVPNCRISRCGYTGEDGFELSSQSDKIEFLTEGLLNVRLNGTNASGGDQLKLAGLGARDTLRLEAGLCLYGHDIDEHVTPIEAGLAWLVAKRRRQDHDFPGADKVMAQLNKRQPLAKRRISLAMQSHANHHVPSARAGTQILQNGEVIGTITSGCPSPTLNFNIAMGFTTKAANEITSDIQLQIRNKSYPAVVTKMPFVKTNYFKNNK